MTAAGFVLLLGCGCVARQPVFDSKSWPWNMEWETFRATVDQVTSRSLVGDRVAMRDLLWIRKVTDTERSDLLDDALLKVLESGQRQELLRTAGGEPYYIREPLGLLLLHAELADAQTISAELELHADSLK